MPLFPEHFRDTPNDRILFFYHNDTKLQVHTNYKLYEMTKI